MRNGAIERALRRRRLLATRDVLRLRVGVCEAGGRSDLSDGGEARGGKIAQFGNSMSNEWYCFLFLTYSPHSVSIVSKSIRPFTSHESLKYKILFWVTMRFLRAIKVDTESWESVLSDSKVRSKDVDLLGNIFIPLSVFVHDLVRIFFFFTSSDSQKSSISLKYFSSPQFISH